MTEAPIRSGSAIINLLFDLCVDILRWLADLFGVSYNAVNIWIFCIIWPILTLVLIAVVIRQRLRIRRLRLELEDTAKANRGLQGGSEEHTATAKPSAGRRDLR